MINKKNYLVSITLQDRRGINKALLASFNNLPRVLGQYFENKGLKRSNLLFPHPDLMGLEIYLNNTLSFMVDSIDLVSLLIIVQHVQKEVIHIKDMVYGVNVFSFSMLEDFMSSERMDVTDLWVSGAQTLA